MMTQTVIANLEPLRAAPPAGSPGVLLPCNMSQGKWVRLHTDPPIYTCDDFLSAAECDTLIAAARGRLQPSRIASDDMTISSQTPGARAKNATRTSWNCTIQHREAAAQPLLARIRALTGYTNGHLEPASVTRYTSGQEYTAHHDGAALTMARDDMMFFAQGGQRIGTVLVYLNDVRKGGGTTFPSLGVTVRPKRGRCLLFFPGFLDGRRDDRVLHAAQPAEDEKWVTQSWIRAREDPISKLTPPRWPQGCKTYGDILKLVFE